MKKFTDTQKQKMVVLMNPEGSNFKDCNFFRFVSMNKETITVEVGYWITYIGCRPKYQKDIVTFRLSELRNLEL